jgi:hypothetical protein
MQFFNKTGVDLILTVQDLNRFDAAGNPFVVVGPTLFTKNEDQPMVVGPFVADGSNNYQVRWAAQTRDPNPQTAGGDVTKDASSTTQEIDVEELNPPNDERSIKQQSATGNARQKPSGTGRVDLLQPIARASQDKATMGGPLGVSISLSAPTTYSMTYLSATFPFTQTITYTETFALVRLDQSYVAAAGGAIGAAVDAVSAWLLTVPVVGAAISGLLQYAAEYYSTASLNPDGSVTLQLAYHYCGTKAGGVDVTATPYPGVPTDQWQGVVNGVQRLAG